MGIDRVHSERAIEALIRAATARLAAAGIDAARREAWLLLEHASGRGRASLIAAGNEFLAGPAAERFQALVERRRQREPIAYILDEKEFWSLPFRLSGAVLTPRPESETVVEAALRHTADRHAPHRILDLGTGSGCLLLALLSELPAAFGVGVDLDPAAVRIAQANARRLGLEDRAGFVRASWGQALAGSFDLIVSNPPYVRTADWRRLAPEIRRFEPAGALLAGEDGLQAYRALAPDVARLAGATGILCLEHAPEQAPAIVAIMSAAGLRPVGWQEDLAGRARVLIVAKT